MMDNHSNRLLIIDSTFIMTSFQNKEISIDMNLIADANCH